MTLIRTMLRALTAIACFMLALAGEARAIPPLGVSADGRQLVQLDGTPGGKPFFWLGDTGWLLSSMCREDTNGDGIGDIDQYLEDRAAKGYNVIQGPIVLRTGSFSAPALVTNCYGEVALLNWFPGPVLLNEGYLAHIDYIVRKAHQYGLYVALPVLWGSTMDIYFSLNSPGDAFRIGQILGQRYNQDNVIWIVAGEYQKIAWDVVPSDRREPTSQELELIRQLALGLEAGHGGARLMTVHPEGGRSSSEHFHAEPWLDFNMVQTYAITAGADDLVLRDWQRSPPKPTINAEPAYEARDTQAVNDPATPQKMRYEAYHSLFQGAFGHTYGHFDVWQFNPGWPSALDAEAAVDMRHLRDLMESRPLALRQPGNDLIGAGAGDYEGLTKMRAARASDGSYAFVYFPNGASARALDLGEISGNTVSAWWFNPADGLIYDADNQPTVQPFATFNAGATQVFSPPANNPQQDWVLVLDDASRNYSRPGVAPLQTAPPPVSGPVPGPEPTPPAIPPAPGLPDPAQSPYPGTPFTIGQRIEAEQYDRGGQGVAYHDSSAGNGGGDFRIEEGVDIGVDPSASGGYFVGSIQTGEWIEYTITVPRTAVYDVQYAVSEAIFGGTFHIEFGGIDVSGPILARNSGNWRSWQVLEVNGLALSAGEHVMRVVFDTNIGAPWSFGSIDWIQLNPRH